MDVKFNLDHMKVDMVVKVAKIAMDYIKVNFRNLLLKNEDYIKVVPKN